MRAYDIFVSYRRDGGEQCAKTIYDRLSEKGYHVFYDVETLRSGAFNTKLYSVIEECTDFIIILSPGALDRCNNEDDWVRLEIAHALRMNKNVIPVLLRNFTFPDHLPEDIEPLRYQNGVQASVEFFDAFLDKLIGYCNSKPGLYRSISKNLSWKRSLIAVACCILLASGIWGIYIVVGQMNLSKSYPVTKQEKNDVKELLYYIELNMTVYDNMLLTMEDAMDSCDSYLLEVDYSGYKSLVDEFSYTSESLEKLSEHIVEFPDGLSESLSDTDVSAADIKMLSSGIKLIKDSYISTLQFLEGIMHPDNIMDMATKKKLFEINNDLIDTEAKQQINGICDALLPISEGSLEEFRTDFLPSLYVLSNYTDQWSRDEITLKSQYEALLTQQDKLMNEYSELVGDMNMAYLQEKSELKALLMVSGLTEDEAEKYIADVEQGTQSNSDVGVMTGTIQEEIETIQGDYRTKYALSEDDDPYMTWTKAVLFLSLYMYEDAVKGFELHRSQLQESNEYVEIYVPAAISFANQMSKLGVNYGVIVAGYQEGFEPNKIYQVGDIIIAVNAEPCKNFDEFTVMTKDITTAESYTATVLRLNAEGTLTQMEFTVSGTEAPVYFLDMQF